MKIPGTKINIFPFPASNLLVFLVFCMAGTVFPQNSNSIFLQYPANYNYEISEKQIIFKWTPVNTGRYRIYIDDNQSFFNPLFTSGTNTNTFCYPDSPVDPRHRLVPGKKYYWKVDALDVYGNAVSTAFEVYSFGVSGNSYNSSETLRDIAIDGLDIFSVGVNNLTLAVKIDNNGYRSESDIDVALYVDNGRYGRKTVKRINPGECKYLYYTVELPAAAGRKIVVTAISDFYDDDTKNNLLSRNMVIPEQYFLKMKGKITGTVSEKIEGKGGPVAARDAVVYFRGTKEGKVFADSNGRYVIDDLPAGSYELRAAGRGYYFTEEKKVPVEMGKVSEFNFEMTRRQASVSGRAVALAGEEADSETVFTIQDFYEKISGFLPQEKRINLQGYEVEEVEGISRDNMNLLIEQLRSKSAKITDIKIK